MIQICQSLVKFLNFVLLLLLLIFLLFSNLLAFFHQLDVFFVFSYVQLFIRHKFNSICLTLLFSYFLFFYVNGRLLWFLRESLYQLVLLLDQTRIVKSFLFQLLVALSSHGDVLCEAVSFGFVLLCLIDFLQVVCCLVDNFALCFSFALQFTEFSLLQSQFIFHLGNLIDVVILL